MVAHLERGCVSLGVSGRSPLGLPRACTYFIGHARGFSTGYAPLLRWHSELPDGVCTLSRWLEKAACGRTPNVRRGSVQVWSWLLPRSPCVQPWTTFRDGHSLSAGEGKFKTMVPSSQLPCSASPSRSFPSASLPAPAAETGELLGQRSQPWTGLTEGSEWGQRSWGSSREAGFSSEKG